MPLLFGPADLTVPLGGRTVSNDQAVHAERIVWGWLKGALGLSHRPNPVPDEVYSWSVQLGAIYLENPTGLTAEELGPAKKQYSAESRATILGEASSSSPTSALSPRGDFPPAPHYPDPASWCS